MYLGFTILLYKYGHPHLTYLPQKFLSKLFFGKSMAQKYPTYLQFGHIYIIENVLNYEKYKHTIKVYPVSHNDFQMHS